MLTPILKSKVSTLWDKFWSGGISNPLNAIEQITYLLFMKQLDENDVLRKLNAEIKDEKYKSVFDGIYFPLGSDVNEPKNGISKETLRWSKIKGTPEQIFHKVQTLAFPFIKDLGDTDSFFAKHMQNAVFLIPKPSLLKDVMDVIDDIYKEIKKEGRFIDTQGDVYEYLLNQLSQAGKNGQFRTPTHIIELIVELVKPKLGDKIADPACGSSGFLLAALKYIITQQTSDEYIKGDENGFKRGSLSDKLVSKANILKLQQETFYGFDIDPTMIRLGLMNLMMHGIENPKIDYKDTLSKFYEEENFYDVILANPPFAGSLSKSEKYPNFTTKTDKTELLFLERIYIMLKDKGTAGVVVPQGVLFGSGKAFVDIRKILIEQCELKTVIALPSGVFKPYAGVATAILIFTKGSKTKNIWFYEMQGDGRSLDDKRAEKFQSNGERNFEDLHVIIEKFNKRDPKKESDRTQQHFFIPKTEIVENNYDLSLSKYKEEIYKEIKYDEPKEIFSRLETIESSISIGIRELKQLL